MKSLINWVKIGSAIGLSVAAILFVAYKQHDASEKYKAHREEYCASVGTIPQQKACQEEGANASDYLPWGYNLISWPEGITTWALMLTLAAVILQTRAYRQSSERQLRAYVVVELVTLLNVAEAPDHIAEKDRTLAHLHYPNSGPVAELKIKNVGQTPAYQLQHWGDICYREYPLTGTLGEVGRQFPPMPMVLGPGIGTVKNFRTLPPLSDVQKEQMRNGTGAIYIQGDVVYTDTFGQKRTTRYRIFHNNLSGVVGTCTSMTFCEDGNTAD